MPGTQSEADTTEGCKPSIMNIDSDVEEE